MPTTTNTSSQVRKRLLPLIIIITCLEGLYPVNSILHKGLFLLSLLAAIGLFLVQFKIKGIISLTTGICLSLLFFWPEKSTVESLQTSYLKELKSFENTPYWWGGENSLGIDCSGLPRKSLYWASIIHGYWNEAFDIWLYDSSAKALSESYRSRTYPVTSLNSVQQHSQLLLPGDLAVTADGIHVMVYLGHNQWIQADPSKDKVHTARPGIAPNPWFNSPVKIVRWTVFRAVKK